MSHSTFSIYVVEDNEWYNKLIVHNLSLNPEYSVKSFYSGKELLEALHEVPDVITLDYRLPDMKGDELLRKIKDFDENIEVVVISEQGDIETAIDILKAGAFDYLVKSNDIRDRIFNVIHNIRKNKGLKSRIAKLEEEVEAKYSFEKTIVGNSAAIKNVYDYIRKAINTNIIVSITGETGTGKEVVAKAIHYNSPRKKYPFVAVNLAAIPSELVESELFGHEKGSFTGAMNTRIGKFEEAGEGTLFLDEIGEMNLGFQAKLLRALQEREITRVGSNKVIKVNCRIMVATHKNLQTEVKKGNFREDLYYRLIGLPIHLPPVREREKDILILAKFFIQKFCSENELIPKTLSADAKKKLLGYHWPGNVREIKSVVELAVVMSQNNEITPDDITLNTMNVLPDILSDNMTMREYQRQIIDIYMKTYNNNTKLVADKLSIGQTTVYRILNEMQVNYDGNA
ncbi:MAG: sigma-54-dependent transcriptional regulator [Bacteroidota bacterium]